MEAVINQALGDVVDGDAAGFLDRAQVDNAFVCHHAVFAGIEHRIVGLQAFGDVIGVENSHLGGAF